MAVLASDRSRRAHRRLALALAVSLGLVAAPTWARSEKTLAYPRDQAWPAAVRFLAVDEHVKITEKDADAGYVMFELRDDGKLFRGSLEVVMVRRDGQSQVRFVLQIADRPSWLEIAMLRRLEGKLRAELGAPAPPPSEPPRKAEPGKDGKGGGPGKDTDKGGADTGKDGADPGKDGAESGKDGGRRDDGPPVSPNP
ncbi:MAG: hypothetical protein E6J90_35175 [Deltaproteobacteria bacterium]|nr:MAG: hypothetical protein E6J90_35175 [Deltaproteobacteria bacterium]TMQ14365.1 MAG: hypothetical protein E6J91_15600 [Deltaproteobacteria bacterium]